MTIDHSTPFGLYLLYPKQLLHWQEERSLPDEDHIYLGILRAIYPAMGMLYVQPLEPDARWRGELIDSPPSTRLKCEAVLVRISELCLPPTAFLSPAFLLHVSI